MSQVFGGDLTLGPVSGAMIAGLIAGEAPPIDLTPYRVERYAEKGASG